MHEIANRDIMSARKPENCLQISGKRRMLITIAAPAAYIKRVQEELSMNEVMNNILTRRSIRKFTDTPISREILDDLVQAALHAPSGMGKQTWKFTVVTNKNAIKRLAEAIKTTLNRRGMIYTARLPSSYRPTCATVTGEKKMMPALSKISF